MAYLNAREFTMLLERLSYTNRQPFLESIGDLFIKTLRANLAIALYRVDVLEGKVVINLFGDTYDIIYNNSTNEIVIENKVIPINSYGKGLEEIFIHFNLIVDKYREVTELHQLEEFELKETLEQLSNLSSTFTCTNYGNFNEYKFPFKIVINKFTHSYLVIKMGENIDKGTFNLTQLYFQSINGISYDYENTNTKEIKELLKGTFDKNTLINKLGKLNQLINVLNTDLNNEIKSNNLLKIYMVDLVSLPRLDVGYLYDTFTKVIKVRDNQQNNLLTLHESFDGIKIMINNSLIINFKDISFKNIVNYINHFINSFISVGEDFDKFVKILSYIQILKGDYSENELNTLNTVVTDKRIINSIYLNQLYFKNCLIIFKNNKIYVSNRTSPNENFIEFEMSEVDYLERYLFLVSKGNETLVN